MSRRGRVRRIALDAAHPSIQHFPYEKQAMEMYGPPPDCKQNRCRGWFGLRKCIRPVCGDKLLAIMESARRWSTKTVELKKFAFPDRLEQRRF